MTPDNKKKFISALNYYEQESLNTALILAQTGIDDGVFDKEEYAGMRRLFARICCTYPHASSIHQIDFYNLEEYNLVINSLIPFLLDAYRRGAEELNALVEIGEITEKQFLYELAFQKTYPRIFVENIADRLKPFHSRLAEFNCTEVEISIGLERLFKDIIMPRRANDIISFGNPDLSNYIDKTFLGALIEANEQVDSLDDINAFSKEPFFPAYKYDESFPLLNAETLIDQFYKTIHRFFMKNSSKEQKDSLMAEKGKNFNEMCGHLFAEGFGFSKAYENIEYINGEIDLLIIDRDCLIVIECKSRNYTDKISGLSRSFEKANRSNLDSAYGQIERFLDYLYSNGNVKCKAGGEKKINLSAKDYKIVIPLVINMENLAEINADYDSRNGKCVYASYDDLTIIKDVIAHRNWLLVDFLQQIKVEAKPNALADDMIDMFAFYCQYKNVGILFSNELSICINGFGNDYFRPYFSFENNQNPLDQFDTDIATFNLMPTESFSDCIIRYHSKYWATIDSFKTN